MKSPANYTFSRWARQGVVAFVGIGIVAAFVLRLSFGLPLGRLAVPIAFLVGIQLVFYLCMYAVRKRYRQTQDLRVGFIITGMYCLVVVLVAMYYASQLGIVSSRTFADNYVEFSILMIVVICLGTAFLSFLKPKGMSTR